MPFFIRVLQRVVPRPKGKGPSTELSEGPFFQLWILSKAIVTDRAYLMPCSSSYLHHILGKMDVARERS
jgi:hypothetical protein